MGAKKKVDLGRLAAALNDFDFAYLITVDDRYHVHTVTVEPVFCDGVLGVGLVGGRTRENLTGRSEATLLWPPRDPNDYSLIVDGRARIVEVTVDDDSVALEILPSRALLHRNADPHSPAAAQGCRHDCVVFAER
jgi:hypothetical protein